MCVCVCVCVCVCFHMCVSMIMPLVGLDVNGFTDMEKEFRLKYTPGPHIAQGCCCVSLELPSGTFVLQLAHI